MEVEDKKVETYNKVMKFISIIMSLVYLAFGLWLLFSPDTGSALSPNQKKIIGGIFIVYSLFRGYRIFRRYFKKDE